MYVWSKLVTKPREKSLRNAGEMLYLEGIMQMEASQ